MAAPLEHLLEQHPVWRGGAPSAFSPAVSTTYSVLDNALPGGGWPTGALTEILSGREGIGELQLVLPALAALSWAGKRVVWLAPPHLPYAPALAAAGLDLAQLAVVRAPGRRDALWAAEQVLRSGRCHALVAWFRRANYDELRRLAVAAEAGAAWAALFRPPETARESSPAALRLVLEPHGEALAVRVLKRRGAPLAAPLVLAVNRPFHALGRPPFPVPAAAGPRADRRVGLPVHA
jgi:cell division inhibitor SulA/protein ImuA